MAKRARRADNPLQMPHRGRFQAQGGTLEESEHWSQLNALPIVDGRNLLSALTIKLRPVHRRERQAYLDRWRIKIDALHASGGYDADIGGHYIKSEPSGASPDEPRVDLEIRKGKAFI